LGGHPHTSVWRLLARQFSSPIVLILVGATVLSGLLGDFKLIRNYMIVFGLVSSVFDLVTFFWRPSARTV
jgi:Mg2+-importing ATPase